MSRQMGSYRCSPRGVRISLDMLRHKKQLHLVDPTLYRRLVALGVRKSRGRCFVYVEPGSTLASDLLRFLRHYSGDYRIEIQVWLSL